MQFLSRHVTMTEIRPYILKSSGSITLFSPDLVLKNRILKIGNINENLGYKPEINFKICL